jgi:putative transposase
MRLLVRPDTVLRWHRDIVARRHAARSRPKRGSRPRTVRSIRALVLRLARENPTWGYRRLHGELLVLGVKVAASTVWEILKDAGIPPAPERTSSTWTDFLRSQADALLACDSFKTITVSGTRLYVFAVLGHGSRRIRVLGATAHPTASWVTQAEKNVVMGHEAVGVEGLYSHVTLTMEQEIADSLQTRWLRLRGQRGRALEGAISHRARIRS